MRQRLKLVFPLLLLALACSRDGQRESLAPREGDREVDAGRLMATVTALADVHTRFMHCYSGTEEALTLLNDILAAQGTPAQPDNFTFFRHQQIDTANLEILFPGAVHPEFELQVGAHWDAIAYPESFINRCSRAPGAVDNATGTAAVIEVARLLQGLNLDYSVRLILFAGEEVGLKGSYRAVDNWRRGAYGDSLVCLINVDMVGQDPDVPDANIVCSAPSGDLAARALDAAQAAVLEVAIDTLLGSIGHPHGSSDHLPYWYNGLPAIWLHEGPEDAAHEANSAADELHLVQADFLADCTRALLAMVIELAGPAD